MEKSSGKKKVTCVTLDVKHQILAEVVEGQLSFLHCDDYEAEVP